MTCCVMARPEPESQVNVEVEPEPEAEPEEDILGVAQARENSWLPSPPSNSRR